MLTILFSWLVIGAAAYIYGKAIVDRAYRDDIRRMGKMDVYIMAGLIFLNSFAQFFSLFYKVAGIACTILGVGGYTCNGVGGRLCPPERESAASGLP